MLLAMDTVHVLRHSLEARLKDPYVLHQPWGSHNLRLEANGAWNLTRVYSGKGVDEEEAAFYYMFRRMFTCMRLSGGAATLEQQRMPRRGRKPCGPLVLVFRGVVTVMVESRIARSTDQR